MTDNVGYDRPANFSYPLPEVMGGQFGESMVTFDLRPSSAIEADMLREIDAIQERLRTGIPQLHREMGALLARVQTPGSL